MNQTEGSHTLKCVVVTPERTVVESAAEFIAIPLYDGELGVLPGRAPLIARLGYGEMRYEHGGAMHRYFLDGGFVQIRDNVVTLLTSKAIPAETLNRASIESEMAAARQPADTPEARDAQQKALAKARAKLRVAEKVGPRAVSVPH